MSDIKLGCPLFPLFLRSSAFQGFNRMQQNRNGSIRATAAHAPKPAASGAEQSNQESETQAVLERSDKNR